MYLYGCSAEQRARSAAAASIRHEMLLYSDPPRHTRLRDAVKPFFAPRRIDLLRGTIERIVGELIESARSAGGMDAIADFARPLPSAVMAEIIGFPPADRQRIERWSSDFSGFFGIGRPDPARNEAALKSLGELADRLAPMIAARRGNLRDDLLSALVAATERNALTERELLATCMTLLIGGYETTIGLIGNGLCALLRHPDQMEALRRNPALIDTAIEELARFDSPAQLATVVATEEITIGRHTFGSGAFVECWIGAANRDPAQFVEPDRLDLGRAPNRHLAFGAGTHYCLGAFLARLEAKAALGAIVLAFPRLKLSRETVRWRPSVVFRSPLALPIELA
jgi:cytochrome P450